MIAQPNEETRSLRPRGAERTNALKMCPKKLKMGEDDQAGEKQIPGIVRRVCRMIQSGLPILGGKSTLRRLPDGTGSYLISK